MHVTATAGEDAVGRSQRGKMRGCSCFECVDVASGCLLLAVSRLQCLRVQARATAWASLLASNILRSYVLMRLCIGTCECLRAKVALSVARLDFGASCVFCAACSPWDKKSFLAQLNIDKPTPSLVMRGVLRSPLCVLLHPLARGRATKREMQYNVMKRVPTCSSRREPVELHKP